ncbi:hypothetical protein FB548_0800 [Pseudoxanthomonas sp. 3HH-4]|jgi:hypothetical protein|uniref:hypothetical protein n=1 Tax=Pseudoxanthomonas sp. 3HH-4 TaxID=1690214 RepID=UPI00114DCA2C|nr:hypothetical protein [Pseudoxanthomonas sp. 3HH-4]TQM17416.1 hypothetical protein FB548_0800 [Pseudoxanthomonas sp. 3HH-4]
MRNLLFVSLFLLAACGGNGASAPAQTTTPEPAPEVSAEPAAVVPSDEFKTSTLRTPLPEGLEFPFSYHRLNDNVKTAEADKERRVFVEILGTAPQQARDALDQALKGKGFVEPVSQQVKGVTEFTYSRADGAQVIVKLDERLNKKKAPNATGTIHLTWRSA